MTDPSDLQAALSPEVLAAVLSVRDRHDEVWSADEVVRMCSRLSDELATELGPRAELVRFAEHRTAVPRPFPDAADPGENGEAVHWMVLVDGVVIDLTRRQFDPSAPVPTVYASLDEAGQHWRTAEPASGPVDLPDPSGSVELSRDELEAEVDLALADAGFTRDEVHVFFSRYAGSDALGAAWHQPGRISDEDRSWPDPAVRAAANLSEHQDVHRVLLPERPASRAEFAALVRHELEHARQWEMIGPSVSHLQEFLLYNVLAYRGNGVPSALVNATPMETDCNAASSTYVRGRFTEAEVRAVARGPRRQLVASLVPPGPVEMLPARTVSFAFQHREGVDAIVARRHEEGYTQWTASKVLEDLHTGGGAMWAALESMPAAPGYRHGVRKRREDGSPAA